MRLKRAEKAKYLSAVQAQANQSNREVVPERASSTASAWHMLCWEHFTDLRVKLIHIGDYMLLDKLCSDTGLPNVTVKEYFRHYDDKQLGMISAQLKDARKGLEDLQALLHDENLRRKNSDF